MAIDPKDLWATLPTALQRQIVDGVAAVLTEASHEIRAGQANAPGAASGRVHPAVDAARAGCGPICGTTGPSVARPRRQPCSTTRPIAHSEKHLANYSGIMQADAYAPGRRKSARLSALSVGANFAA